MANNSTTNDHVILNIGTPKPNNYLTTINSVISQSSNTVEDQQDVKKIQKRNARKKRTNSLNSDGLNDKRQRNNIHIDNFTETSKFINIIMERLDLLEDECNRLEGVNNVLKEENINIKDNYCKLQSKHSNLYKEFSTLKAINTKIQSELTILDSKVTNQNSDEMNGIPSNQMSPTSFADMLKIKKDKAISEPMAEIINTINDYSKQKKGRENNVIIFGLKNVNKETVNDNVKSLFEKMKTGNIKFKNPVLLVKNGATVPSPPVKVTLENEDIKFQLLKAAKILKVINDKDQSNISISQDLNDVDRLLHKKLVHEKKELNNNLTNGNITNYYYGIRGNKVVKIDK